MDKHDIINVFQSIWRRVRNMHPAERVVWLLLTSIVVVGGLIFLYLSGWADYQRIDVRLQYLERLHNLSGSDINSDPKLAPIFNGIANDVTELGHRHIALPYPGFIFRENQLKFLTGGLIGWIFVLYGLTGLIRGTPGSRNTFIGALIFAICFGIVGVVIPTFMSPLINYSINLLIQVLAIFGLVKWQSRKTTGDTSGAGTE